MTAVRGRRTKAEAMDMSESEAAKVAGRLQRRDVEATWHDAVNEAIELLHATISNWPADKEPPLHELADADQVAHEIESLRQQLADAQYNAESFRAQAESASSANQTWMEWVEELEQRVTNMVERAEAAEADRDRLQKLADKTALAAADRTLQAEHSGELGRVQELERQLADALVRAEQAEQDRVAAYSAANEADLERKELVQARELLATAYVAREVPWSDVAAGMMTLSREEHPRPWMVEGWVAAGTGAKLRNGDDTFVKTPATGETVRVLVPYVTPEQAEALVKSELGGRA